MLTELQKLKIEYSDLYKEVRGFRPSLTDLSELQLEARIDRLHKEHYRDLRAEEQCQRPYGSYGG